LGLRTACSAPAVGRVTHQPAHGDARATHGVGVLEQLVDETHFNRRRRGRNLGLGGGLRDVGLRGLRRLGGGFGGLCRLGRFCSFGSFCPLRCFRRLGGLGALRGLCRGGCLGCFGSFRRLRRFYRLGAFRGFGRLGRGFGGLWRLGRFRFGCRRGFGGFAGLRRGGGFRGFGLLLQLCSGLALYLRQLLHILQISFQESDALLGFFQRIVFRRQIISRCSACRLCAALGVVGAGETKLILGRFLEWRRFFFLGCADLPGCLTASLRPGRRCDRDPEAAAIFVEVGVLRGNDAARIRSRAGRRPVLVRNADDLARAQAVHVVGDKRFLIRAEQRHEHLLKA